MRSYSRFCIELVQLYVIARSFSEPPDPVEQQNLSKIAILTGLRLRAVGGTVVANREDRTRRVDKGKSGQARKTAVSGGFGGGILSQDLKQVLALLGERSNTCDAVDEQQ